MGQRPPASLLSDFTGLPRDRLIVHGELFSPDGARPAGVVWALQAPSREAVEALVGSGQAGLDKHFDVQILDWEFGGRR